MQLKKSNSALAAAAMSLLGSAAPAVAEDHGWVIDTGTLVYSESNGRVQAVEPKIIAGKDLGNDRSVQLGLTLDVLTGSSPNGAAPASQPQTFTQPSGRGTYTTAPGEQPLDGTFKDTRVALDASYHRPLGSDKISAGVAVSKEYDYLSLGVNGGWSRDFNKKNTTFSVGLGYANDSLNPEGGVPMGLRRQDGGGTPNRISDTESKQVADLVLGLTQILTPDSLLQLNYSYSHSSGYLNDPFKFLSVVDAAGAPQQYVFENRPDTRTKHALYAEYKQFTSGRDVVDASYRLLTDDWGITSHTADLSYRWNVADNRYWEPHLRTYVQSEADFYRAALFTGEEAQLRFASADPRLGAYTGYTLGIKYGRTLTNGNPLTLRLEYYTQQGKTTGVPVQAGQALSQFDLAPTLDAAMLTVGYRFKW